MPGSEKKAQRLAKHLNEQVDAACTVTRPGAAVAQAGAAVGGAIGAGLAQVGKGGGGGAGDISIGRGAWLGLGPDGFTLTGIDLLMGNPKGDPIARVAYAEVTSVTLVKNKIALRADVVLSDGRGLAFETKRLGPANKPAVEVVELFQARCGG